MNHAHHLALATSAGDSALAALLDPTEPGADKDDRYRRSQGRATDGGADVLREELLMLRKRCRARELALASLAGALNKLRRANRALNEENILLRRQISEQRSTTIPQIDGRRLGPGHSVVSDG